MSSHVRFDADVTTASPSGSPDGRDESASVAGSNAAQKSSQWVPVLLELRLRCERVDSDGTSQCVWMLQDDETDADFRFESVYFKGSKNDEKAPVVQQ
jgi:hypothetical protein